MLIESLKVILSTDTEKDYRHIYIDYEIDHRNVKLLRTLSMAYEFHVVEYFWLKIVSAFSANF